MFSGARGVLIWVMTMRCVDLGVDDVAREIATSFKKLHPAPAASDAKK